MTRYGFVAGTWVAVWLGLSPAQAQPTVYEPVYPAGGPRRIVGLPFGPDCHDVRGRILTCVPRVYISPDAPGVAQIIDAPPPERRRPYPEFFNW